MVSVDVLDDGVGRVAEELGLVLLRDVERDGVWGNEIDVALVVLICEAELGSVSELF